MIKTPHSDLPSDVSQTSTEHHFMASTKFTFKQDPHENIFSSSYK